MNKQEFEQRTGIKVSEGFYHGVVEPLYYEDKRDKDEFCADWLKQYKELKKADLWESYMRHADQLYNMYTRQERRRSEKEREIISLEMKIEDLQTKINKMNAKAAKNETDLERLLHDTIALVTSEKETSLDEVKYLLRLAIMNAKGRHYFLTKKLEQNMPLWDDERQWLIDMINVKPKEEDEEEDEEED